jgi:hypothetical protein
MMNDRVLSALGQKADFYTNSAGNKNLKSGKLHMIHSAPVDLLVGLHIEYLVYR